MSARDDIVCYLESMLEGPGFGEPDPVHGYSREVISNRLSLAYMMGLLYPRQTSESELGDLGSDEGGDSEVDDDQSDDPLSMAASLLPASLGLSFCVPADATVSICASAAVYDPFTSDPPVAERKWQRRPLEDAITTAGPGGVPRTAIWGGLAELEVLERKLPDNTRLLTVSLANRIAAQKRADIERALFQVKLVCSAPSSEILPYPASRFIPPTAEERELRVMYGEQRPYAAGHGISTDWKIVENVCKSVSTAALPRTHVWRPLFDKLEYASEERTESFADYDIFSLSKLATGELSSNELAQRLGELLKFYHGWIDEQKKIPVNLELQPDAQTIIGRCEDSAARMTRGLQRLVADPQTYEAFVLANRAMLMAMAHSARASGRDRDDGLQGPFELGMAETSPIDYFANASAKWRPFQLAFFLQILPSLLDPSDDDRDLVDVIWFPTGGGKTEAYLLVAAFELIRRRLAHPSKGHGVGVINRYTYRFLTADQFQRTAGMICALEALRRELSASGDDRLGEREYSIGLFVGGDVSPNNYTSAYDDKGAHALCLALLESPEPRSDNKFPIESCPYCGTLLVPERRRILPDGAPDRAFYGFESSANSFTTRCTDEDCEFHTHLPVYFIDTQVYSSQPSFLLGTIDKFAMVPWKEEGGLLFGAGKEAPLPPTLIIQDELHLISGPLGTLAGVYEAAFETIITHFGGTKPKIIASTATIRNAATQCRRIYGKDSVIFPSPGVRSEDSFFSKMDIGNTERSRMYVGLMGQGLRSTIAVSWAMAALLQGTYALSKSGAISEAELDAYWTLVAYHNSKRELGRIANATRDEIPTRLKVYAKATDLERPATFKVLELKAHSELPVPQARQQLAKRHTASQSAIDIAPCTSIISVGIDIDRLGLMLVNGQPKLTAEYIQATSRVGRGSVPGLVISCYSPSKPRDRSHYEAFRDYHDRFYSFVEPTSVTPGAFPAIQRALHAALVAVVRHAGGLTPNQSARAFDPGTAKIAKVITAFEHRLRAAYHLQEESEIRDRISDALAARIADWSIWAATARESGSLDYTVATNQKRPALLYRFRDTPPEIGWPTLQSMRHVDDEIILGG